LEELLVKEEIFLQCNLCSTKFYPADWATVSEHLNEKKHKKLFCAVETIGKKVLVEIEDGKTKKDQTELPLLEIEESDESDNVIELKCINVEKRASN